MFDKKLELPLSGLIVSCYLESMHGAEEIFIDAVAKCPGLVALRIEGINNILFAKKRSKLPIIGLIKNKQQDGSYITACLNDLYKVQDAGADFVAIDSRLCNKSIGLLYMNAKIPIMADIETISDGIEAAKLGAVVLATTFIPKAFDLLRILKQYVEIPINLEGGIETREEIRRAFDSGASYVTIGKMINDPPTIIKHFLDGNIA